jgi:exosortase
MAWRSWFVLGPPVLLMLGLFHFFGNTVRGYIDTPSLWVWWVKQWFTPGSELEHAPFLLAASGWVFHREWRRFRFPGATKNFSKPRLDWAFGLFSIALGLHLAGLPLQQTRLSLVAFFLLAAAIAVAYGGLRALRAAPAAFLLMLGTLPLGFLGDELGFHLRLFVIELTEHVCAWSGLAVVRSGTLLSAPDGSFLYDVAPACSGIRSLAALFALVLLLGILRFQTWWRRLLLLALTPLLVIAGNVFRLGAIIAAAHWGGEAWGSRVHDSFGFVVFIVVFAGAMLAAEGIQKICPESIAELEEDGAGKAEAPPPLRRRARRQAMLFLSLGLIAAAPLVALSANIPEPLPNALRLAENGRDPARLPLRVSPNWWGRPVEVSSVEREILPEDTGFSRKIYRNPDGHDLLFSIVLSGKDRSSLHRPELCLVGQGWTIVQKTLVELPAPEILPTGLPGEVTRLKLHKMQGSQKVEAVMYYFYLGSQETAATTTARIWQDARLRLQGKPVRWAYIVLQILVPEEKTTLDIAGIATAKENANPPSEADFLLTRFLHNALEAILDR